ncbi:MAG: hypothetical protein A2X61_13315 [Ignavibacteria bacterium GWB2_35_12]|nr:MAG: hypothetical protein A2X63_12525 [Ignavibacteria bacterium GWA2_35_8]OGU41438.1 MAG: hypothetical protein A2X61_13315 [Ignavibacteria bacterium GWB2_35_12]OGU94999.1 MAG: hypothetical protein A2220_09525 [Ignavibacteria bacterium RIFOXYA2_FULL_35_10]OGV19386.1 MAG: hypothetical protein A2475_04775 [Ignavibacteria bacterium RIFOXYC2_FULL_35_21]
MIQDGIIYLKLSKEFSITPGPRKKEEGKFSGELFLNSLLIPKFQQALKENNKLVVDLDGSAGYASSFLDEAFRGLSSKFGKDIVLKNLEIITNEEPYLYEEIISYIKESSYEFA